MRLLARWRNSGDSLVSLLKDMDKDYLETWSKTLQDCGVALDTGLSDKELCSVEATYGFHFPPDLRKLLQHATPIGDKFPNWRGTSEGELRKRLEWPVEGVRFDVEHSNFWLPSWGPKPVHLEDALERARRAVAHAPTLIPVFSHRYIPEEPHSAGNPVLSVYQTDIIHYGNDLASYFHREFGVPEPKWAAKRPRQIRFWDELIEFGERTRA